jgi:phosphatidylglycerophosphatase A
MTFALFTATGCGVGLVPVAPGTFGSLLGLPLAWGIAQLPVAALQVGVIAGIVAAGIPICTAAARQLGRAKDPGAIVLDEIAAMPVVFAGMAPGGLSSESIWVWVAGFALFRLFDILKPPPARQLERLPDGLGIMADDLAAAVFAWAGLKGLMYLGAV